MAPRLPIIRPLYSDTEKTPPVATATTTTIYRVTDRAEDGQKDSEQPEITRSTETTYDVTPTSSISGDAELDDDEVFCKGRFQ